MALKLARDSFNNLTFIWDSDTQLMYVSDNFGNAHMDFLQMRAIGDSGQHISILTDVHEFIKTAQLEHEIEITNTVKAITAARKLTRTKPVTYQHYVTSFYVQARDSANGRVVNLSELRKALLDNDDTVIHNDEN